jgi:hypothetical protein
MIMDRSVVALGVNHVMHLRLLFTTTDHSQRGEFTTVAVDSVAIHELNAVHNEGYDLVESLFFELKPCAPSKSLCFNFGSSLAPNPRFHNCEATNGVPNYVHCCEISRRVSP